MGHVEDRARERTRITDREIASARSYVKNHRKSFRKGQTYSIVAPGRKGYYIVGDVGDKRKKHVIKTVYGVNMRPPGNLIQNAKLEHDLVKAAAALFALEKTASTVAYPIALMEYDKVAAAYFGYDLEEWLDYPEEMRKEASRFQAGLGALNQGASKVFNRLGMTSLAKQHANVAARRYGTSARNIERQVGLTGDINKATKLQAEAAEQSARASQQARIGGDAALAERQALHAQRQVGNAQANVSNQVNAARAEGQAAHRADYRPNMDSTPFNPPNNLKITSPTKGTPTIGSPTAGSPQKFSMRNNGGMTPRQQQNVQEFNRRNQAAGENAVTDFRFSTPGANRAMTATENAAQAVQKKVTGNPNIVNTKAPKVEAAPPPPNAGTTPPTQGGATGGKSTGGKTTTPPTTDANAPINFKQVGIGAGLATAGLGAGYGGMKYVQNRNKQRQQMMGGMPKMASWFSFTEKTASYTDALGMYKEALSRADKNLLNDYQKAVSDARAAVKGEGKALVEMQNKYKAMPKGPERSAAIAEFKKAQRLYNRNLNNPPSVESFLQSKGYTGKQLEVTRNNLQGKLFGTSNSRAFQSARNKQDIIEKVVKNNDLKQNQMSTLDTMKSDLKSNDELFERGRQQAGRSRKNLRVGETQSNTGNAYKAEERAAKYLKRKGVDMSTPEGKAALEELSERLYDARTTRRGGSGVKGKTYAGTYGPNTTYHFDPNTGAPRSRAAKRAIQNLSPEEQARISKLKSFPATQRSNIAMELDQIDRGVKRTGTDALQRQSSNLQAYVDRAREVKLEEQAAVERAEAAAKQKPTPVQTTTQPKPTPAPQNPTPATAPQTPPPKPTGQAPLPNAENVNPRQAANVTSKVDAPKPMANQAVSNTAEAAAKPTTAAPMKSVGGATPSAPKPVTPKVAPKGRLGMVLGGTALAGAGLYGLNKMMKPNQQEKAASIEYRGRTFPGYNKPMKSDRPNKKKMVLAKKGGKVKLIHYGHSGYQHNYSKGAKKNYLTRSAGIRNKSGELTMNDKFSANYWARRDLWPQGQKADGSDKKR